MLMKNAKISVMFIIICIVCAFIWWYFSDFKTAFIVFLGYAAVRIIANFFRRTLREEYYE